MLSIYVFYDFVVRKKQIVTDNSKRAIKSD